MIDLPDLRPYIAFWRSKKISITAQSSLDAQTQAVKVFGAKKSWEVTVVLADTPVDPASL